MVLEDILSPGDGFANDEVPPPDGNEPHGALAPGTEKFTVDSTRTVADASATVLSEELHLRYRANKGPLRHYRIPFDRMPVQGITRRAAFGNPGRTSITSRSLIELMSLMETLNGRPLTQSEAEGVALHLCRKRVYSQAAAYGGIVAGCAWAFYKRKTFKFPLRKPKPVERYDAFPLQRAAFLTGRYARMAWHTTRTMAYIGASWLMLLPLFEYMGRSAQAIHMMRDERTRALAQEFRSSLQRAQRDIQEDLKRKIEQSFGGTADGQGAGQSSSPSDQPDSQSSGYGEYYGGSKGGYVQDANSPTSPSSQHSQYPYSDTSSNTGLLSDAQMQSRTRSQRSSPSSSDPSNRNTFSLEKVDRQPRTFDSEYNPPNDSSSSSSPFFDDNDASPTAGNDPFPDSPSTPSPAHAPIPPPIRQRPPTPTKERQGRIRDQRGQLQLQQGRLGEAVSQGAGAEGI
ncbi:hypothetical protein EPUS_08183 [Endocarpon pusillum Z07020]|uniref:Uncharacterized protein n=1 Tax=Endocarpon pusillum (strain Z07020 / HMAS-L-300199) TaxID=1263415 RepID=U1HJ55_ENDPU|nr:uncharacterized protein EPUS_08183 [Endocarpon pusillum Z07020]ERF68949.1 hypothetical protein EPUS_08183 [Endocarpon pusillum Z07020]